MKLDYSIATAHLLDKYGKCKVQGLGISYQQLWNSLPASSSSRYAIRLALLKRHARQLKGG